VAILPNEISLEPRDSCEHAFGGFFGKFEMDWVAQFIVTLCTKSNTWRKFTLSEVLSVGRQSTPRIDDDYIIEGVRLLWYYGWIELVDVLEFEAKDIFITRCVEKTKEYSSK